LKPCCAEEARRSTWIDWPPMPAPPSTVASIFVGSEEVVACWGFQSAAEFKSLAAVLTASSFVLIICRSVLC
jgi:hypothetical protein